MSRVLRAAAWTVGVLVLLFVAVAVLQRATRTNGSGGGVSVPATDPASQATAAPTPTSVTVPDGHLVFDSDRTGTFELFTMAPDGSQVRQLTDDPAYDSWWGRISPDRRQVLFQRTPAGVHDQDYRQISLWMVNADGSGLRRLRAEGTDGWAQQGHAEWSPDGASIVVFGGPVRVNPQIWVLDADGTARRQVTDRGGQNLDPSYTSDGRAIVFVGCPRRLCFPSDYEVYRVGVAGGEPERLTEDRLRDHDPRTSPDGNRIAWLTQTDDGGAAGEWNIRIAAADGSGVRRVTDDDNVSSLPEWSRDGSLLYFHRLVYGRGDGFQIWRIRPDGTRMEEVTDGHPGVNEYPSS